MFCLLLSSYFILGLKNWSLCLSPKMCFTFLISAGGGGREGEMGGVHFISLLVGGGVILLCFVAGSHSVAQPGLELMTLLPQLPHPALTLRHWCPGLCAGAWSRAPLWSLHWCLLTLPTPQEGQILCFPDLSGTRKGQQYIPKTS